MDIPYDIGSLDPNCIIRYEIEERNEYTYLYLWHQCPGTPAPESWNFKFVVKKPEGYPFRCDKCGFYNASPLNGRCRACGNLLKLSSTATPTKEKLKFGFKHYTKENAKDSLVKIGGRDCLILGVTEAGTPKEPNTLHDVVLLSFYQVTASENLKHEVLQFCYYCTSTGELFEDKHLTELNDLLWRETTQHYFRVIPKWNVVKISEIYQNGRV